MHIYKKPMDPVIGNERLALTECVSRNIPHVHAGPDVWEPTSKQYPKAFAGDRVHPNSIGAEIMAQKWFETLLKHDGLEVPEWSRQEMADAIKGKPVPPGRGGRAGSRPGAGRQIPQRILDRYDKDGDGKLNEQRARAEDVRRGQAKPGKQRPASRDLVDGCPNIGYR